MWIPYRDDADLPDFSRSVLAIILYYVICASITSFVVKAKDVVRVKAWLITSLSSVVTVAVGIYMLVNALDNADRTFLGLFKDVDDKQASRQLAHFFLAYCVCDSVIGYFQYHSEMTIGYSHHALYAVLLWYLLWTEQTLLFGMCALEELPTILLCVYKIMDIELPVSYGLLFFAFRVFFHLWVSFTAINHTNSFVFFISMCILVQHIRLLGQWFSSLCRRVYNPKKEPQETENFNIKARVNIALSLVCLYLCLHGMLLYKELQSVNERATDMPLFLLEVALHLITFCYVVVEIAKTVQGVYEEHFIMTAIKKMTIIYNISWEDPRVEREYLKIGSNDKILTISSAGCNVLDYLIEGPKAIVAADLNGAQLSCLDLKLACIKTMEHDEFFQLWGESNLEIFKKYYKSKLRPLIRDQSKVFWDEQGETLFGENFMFAGTSGLAAWFLQIPLRLSGMRSRMLTGKSNFVADIILNFVVSIFKRPLLWQWVAPLGGVPKAQLDLIKREPHVFSERIAEISTKRMWASDNYFYYGYIVGKFAKHCCPRYLEEAHFPALKKYVDRVQIHHGPLAEAATLHDDYTFASLLDSMDWMPNSMIAEQMAGLIPHMVEGGHIFWRSFGTKVHSPVLAALKPVEVHTYDRVGWYLTQYMAEVPSKKTLNGVTPEYPMLLNSGSSFKAENTLFDDVFVMGAMVMHGLRSQKDVRAFYKSQGTRYDGFREYLLPNRDTLLVYGIPWFTKPKTWLSVGCGTARDIEYVVGHIKAAGTHVYLFDLSPELLEIAKARVERLGIESQVTIVEGDITTAFASKDSAAKLGLPPAGSFDVVTCSYCLTMIPPWKKALDEMVNAVKPGGTLALLDFTRRSDQPNHWQQRLNTWWFSNDGVYFNHEHTDALLNDKKLSTIWFNESEAPVPYTPLVATNYIYIGSKNLK